MSDKLGSGAMEKGIGELGSWTTALGKAPSLS